MRIYSAASEEALGTRKLLADWAGEGVLTQEQYEHLRESTVSELRTTNIFLRLVLFLFTLISVAALAGLFFELFLKRSSGGSLGIFFLLCAVGCYIAAEVAASRVRLYRHGIEEGLAVCSVGCLCLGLAFISGGAFPPDQFLVPAAGALSSLWIWRRFGLWYAFPAAMIFALFLPDYWTSSHSARHAAVALIYATGLTCVMALRSGRHADYGEDDYSPAEAFLWLGIYLVINLQISSAQLNGRWWEGGAMAASEFASWFYWVTWVLIWCLPPIVIARGIRKKDRLVMAVGGITAILTLIFNKPYLGWTRHTWDPMLLGILLAGVALFVRRWLALGPGGVRHGFTTARLSGKDKEWMSASATVLGLVTPQTVTPSPQAKSADFHFQGGASGGGGAGGDF